MFDCVLPTRIARNGTCMTSQGRLVVKNAQLQKTLHRWILNVIATLVRITPELLRHLLKADETFGIRLTRLPLWCCKIQSVALMQEVATRSVALPRNRLSVFLWS